MGGRSLRLLKRHSTPLCLGSRMTPACMAYQAGQVCIPLTSETLHDRVLYVLLGSVVSEVTGRTECSCLHQTQSLAHHTCLTESGNWLGVVLSHVSMALNTASALQQCKYLSGLSCLRTRDCRRKACAAYASDRIPQTLRTTFDFASSVQAVTCSTSSGQPPGSCLASTCRGASPSH